MKLCNSCKYFEEKIYNKSYSSPVPAPWWWSKTATLKVYESKNYSCNYKNLDVVTGEEISPVDCYSMRSYKGPCGPDAKLWVAKE